MYTSAACRTLAIQELLEHIIRIVRAVWPANEFVHLSLVSCGFHEAVSSIFWKEPAGDVFRPMLSLTGDYDVKPDNPGRLTVGIQSPSPDSWHRFISISGHIRILKLNFSTVRSLAVLHALLQTAPARFRLPQLRALEISMDHLEEHGQLAQRFMQETVIEFSLLVFPPWRPMYLRSETLRSFKNPLEDQLEQAASQNWSGIQGPRSLSMSLVPNLCTAIGKRMPHLSRLQFVIAQAQPAFYAFSNLVDMVLGLRQLETLFVARHTAVAPLLCMISEHPCLRILSIFQADFLTGALRYQEIPEDATVYIEFWTLWDMIDESTDIYNTVERGFVSENLTELRLEIDPAQFRDVLSDWLDRDDVVPFEAVENLHLMCSTPHSGLQGGEDEIEDILAAIPDLFPVIKRLRVGPIRWNLFTAEPTVDAADTRYAVTANTLRALKDCHTLEHLQLDACYQSRVSSAEWDELLPNWPNLQVMILGSTSALRIDIPDAPIDRVLSTFSRHCRRMRMLSVHMSSLISSSPSTWSCPPMLSNFYPVISIPANTTQAAAYALETLKNFLNTIRRQDCAVRLTLAHSVDAVPHSADPKYILLSTWREEAEMDRRNQIESLRAQGLLGELGATATADNGMDY